MSGGDMMSLLRMIGRFASAVLLRGVDLRKICILVL